MGLDPLTLTSIGVSALMGGAQIAMAQQQASAQAEAAANNAAAAYNELGIRQQEAVDKAAEAKSDRAAQADRELATLRVVAGEGFGLGTVNFARQVGEVGAMEGIDVSRIEANRDREIAALQRSKEAAATGARSAMKSAEMTGTNGAISGGLGIASSGLQIYSGHARNKALVEATKGRVT